jgi:Zn-dependent M28 family amino/carboxypeptidase
MIMRTGLFGLMLALGMLWPVSAPLAHSTTDPMEEDSAEARLDASAKLRRKVTVERIRDHQAVLQAMADWNDGTRVSGSPGFDRSADYVFRRLKRAGYDVRFQEFEFAFFAELAPSELRQTAPTPTEYANGTDFRTVGYSGNGNVTARVQAVDINLVPPRASTSGCEAADFADFVPGRIALVQRGTCPFGTKALNAAAAGAAGIIIFNQGNGTPEANADRFVIFSGTLGEPVAIPALSVSHDFGAALSQLGASLELNMVTQTISEIRTTRNVLADTKTGDPTRIVVVGAHLDSVEAGPGINDNGSGTATILELALRMAELWRDKRGEREEHEGRGKRGDHDEHNGRGKRSDHDEHDGWAKRAERGPRNLVRFAFWGAEESGLLGSEYYVAQLSETDLANHLLNLNFDMVGSPNFVRFIYDGDGSAGLSAAGPEGSAFIEEVFQEYFASNGLETAPTAFDGRSDYGPFILSDIPAGGLFTGAEGIKTAAQAAVYGGTAGIAYDPCYHQACDTFDNVSKTALDQMSNGAAHAAWTFAHTARDLRDMTAPLTLRRVQPRLELDYRGPRLQR